MPEGARWEHLRSQAGESTFKSLIDNAMREIEGANPPLSAVLPKDYGLRSLDKRFLE